MFNPRKTEDFRALVDAVNDSRNKLRPFREKRRELIEAFVGSEYSDEGEAKAVYLNLLSLVTNVYVRQCAIREPAAVITSPFPDMRPLAADLELACAEVAKETALGRTLRRAVTEAFFSPMATVKVGLESLGKQEYYGEEIEATQPYVDLVSFDDYVRDMSARSAYCPAFEGDIYYLTRDELAERYPSASGKLLEHQELSMQDEYGADRAEGLSHSQVMGDVRFKNKIAIQDVWLTKERMMVTYMVAKPDKPLAVVEFESNEDGPYYSLWFTDVPDNAMPLPPFSTLKNIHLLANNLFRRLAHQAKVHKRVVAFSDEESANRYSAAHDGDGIYYDQQPPVDMKSGGIDQPTLGFMIQLRDMFSWAAGNLDTLGGLSPMSDTARQDELINQSASAHLADMQDATAEFAKRIFKQLAWYEWTDPLRERILEKGPKNTKIRIPVAWSPETRSGDFLEFNFNINPLSMRDDGPGAKLQKLQGVIMNFFSPLMPFMEQQGMSVDVRRLVEIVAENSNLPELEQIIVSLEDDGAAREQQNGDASPTPSTKPSHTVRTYERVNRPGGTRHGKDAALTQVLMGGGVQDDEAAALTRSNS